MFSLKKKGLIGNTLSWPVKYCYLQVTKVYLLTLYCLKKENLFVADIFWRYSNMEQDMNYIQYNSVASRGNFHLQM